MIGELGKGLAVSSSPFDDHPEEVEGAVVEVSQFP